MNFNFTDQIQISGQSHKKVVGIGDMKFCNSESTIQTHALGSCIGMAVYDPIARAGALLHYMLPDSTLDVKKSVLQPYMFADTGILGTLTQLTQLGCKKNRLIVKIAGGANIMDPHGVFNIGKRNILALKKILWKLGIVVRGKDIGGNTGRNLTLNLKTHQVTVRYNGQREELVI